MKFVFFFIFIWLIQKHYVTLQPKTIAFEFTQTFDI